MKLRVARKMDTKRHDPRRGSWWIVYSSASLERAERRLYKSWATHRTREIDADGKVWLGVTPDFFAANRVQSRRIRQQTINGLRRGKWPF